MGEHAGIPAHLPHSASVFSKKIESRLGPDTHLSWRFLSCGPLVQGWGESEVSRLAGFCTRVPWERTGPASVVLAAMAV